MGMGYGAAFGEIIQPEDIEKLCPKQWAAFIKALDETEDGETIDSFAQEAMFGENDPEANSAVVYKQLCEAFEKKTGLSLGVSYHDSESEGSRYDDVDGSYWWVEGMYQLSPAGKKMEKVVQRMFWVNFG
jgi:hypothetical protein